MAIQVPNLVNAFLQGRQARSQMDQDERKNALLDMQIANAPQEQAQRNKLLELQTRGAEQDLMLNRQKAEAEQTGIADKRKQGALKQVGIFSQQALASPDPRGFVAAALANPQYAEIFTAAGIDPVKAQEGLNSPDFERNLQIAATMGDQVSADNRFDAEEAQKQREFTARENAATRANALQVAEGRIGAQEQKAASQADNTAKQASAKLRKEFRGLQSVKDYEATLPLIESAKKAPDTRQGDLQLIYTVGKVLDPGSVVREGELKLTAGAAPFLQQLAGKLRGEFGKGRLTPQTRAELIDALEQRQSGYRDAYTRDFDTYSQYATDSGADPFAIVGNRPETAYQPQQGGAPVQIKSEAEYGALPSGAKYIGPDGKMRQKR